MKCILIAFALIIISDTPSKVSKADLICQKWIEVGLKVFGKEYRTVDKQSAEILSFHKNGTLEKELYSNLKFKGLWKFSNDSNKIAIEWTELNANPLRNTPINKVKPTDSILKLSADSMILGTLKQYGDLRIHGHDDRYFVKMR